MGDGQIPLSSAEVGCIQLRWSLAQGRSATDLDASKLKETEDK